jgi:hypothetical protein
MSLVNNEQEARDMMHQLASLRETIMASQTVADLSPIDD